MCSLFVFLYKRLKKEREREIKEESKRQTSRQRFLQTRHVITYKGKEIQADRDEDINKTFFSTFFTLSSHSNALNDPE